MNKLKIAASTYLNSAPLIYSFLQGSLKDNCYFLGNTAPARCADLLAENLVDIALIPVIEYQRINNICLIPDISVSAKQAVRSVILVSKCPIDKINTVALDISSRTSATLVKIILERFYSIKPHYITSPPNLKDMLTASDSALLIGDPAITVELNNYHVYDLAQEWRKFTGLPFVFALWAVNNCWSDNAIDKDYLDLAKLFVEAKKEGINNLNNIVKEYSYNLNISPVSLLDYLTSNVNYNLDKENLAGLEYFYKLAAELGLILENRPIKFFTKLNENSIICSK
ncbi:MAG: menaquinone biosynthesis protein [Acidobacteria bacterium]|nr:menaquinone biosynthesis protein [Acidobacteriota bacterium]